MFIYIILYRQVKRSFPWYFTSSELRHRNCIQWVGDWGFKFFSQWRCSETTWCSSCEGKATVCLVSLKIIDIVCILAQKIINLQHLQNLNIKISCCDFVEKHCFKVLCLYQVSISNQQSKIWKKCETDAGRSKNQAWFLFEKYQSFLLFVDRACEIVQTPLSSCRLFFLGARSPQEQHTLSSPHFDS